MLRVGRGESPQDVGPRMTWRLKTHPNRGLFGVRALLVSACVFYGGMASAQEAPASEPTAAVAAPAAEAATPAAPATEAAPAAAEPAPASAEAAPAEAANIELPDEAYQVRMRNLEEKVSALKERIHQSKAKLTLLTEAVTGGLGAGAKLVVRHKNDMGGAFLLVRRDYFLDGTPLRQDIDESGAKLTDERDLVIFDGPIVEGSHSLVVNLIYKGNGTGVFSYLDGYTFKLRDSLTFTAEQGKVTTIDAVGFEQGDFTTQLLERPAIRFDTAVVADKASPAE